MPIVATKLCGDRFGGETEVPVIVEGESQGNDTGELTNDVGLGLGASRHGDADRDLIGAAGRTEGGAEKRGQHRKLAHATAHASLAK